MKILSHVRILETLPSQLLTESHWLALGNSYQISDYHSQYCLNNQSGRARRYPRGNALLSEDNRSESNTINKLRLSGSVTSATFDPRTVELSSSRTALGAGSLDGRGCSAASCGAPFRTLAAAPQAHYYISTVLSITPTNLTKFCDM